MPFTCQDPNKQPLDNLLGYISRPVSWQMIIGWDVKVGIDFGPGRVVFRAEGRVCGFIVSADLEQISEALGAAGVQ